MKPIPPALAALFPSLTPSLYESIMGPFPPAVLKALTKKAI
jgi:hypothetical protein